MKYILELLNVLPFVSMIIVNIKKWLKQKTNKLRQKNGFLCRIRFTHKNSIRFTHTRYTITKAKPSTENCCTFCCIFAFLYSVASDKIAFSNQTCVNGYWCHYMRCSPLIKHPKNGEKNSIWPHQYHIFARIVTEILSHTKSLIHLLKNKTNII